MKKVFTKIAGLSVGLAMAIGVGVAVGSKEARVARADNYAYSGSSHDYGDWSYAASKGSGSNTPTDTRLYANNVLEFTSSGSAFSEVIVNLTINANKNGKFPGEPTISAGSVSGYPTAAGTGKSFTISLDDNVTSFTVTLGGTAGNWEIKSFDITWAGSAVTKYTVSFDANGGTGTMTSQKVEEGEKYLLPDCTFGAPANKTFKCWSVNSVEKDVGEEITVNADVTISAVWKDIERVDLPDGEYTVNVSYSRRTSVPASEYFEIKEHVGDTYYKNLKVDYSNVQQKYSNEYTMTKNTNSTITVSTDSNATIQSVTIDFYQYVNAVIKVGGVDVTEPISRKGADHRSFSADIKAKSFSIVNESSYDQSLWGFTVELKVSSVPDPVVNIGEYSAVIAKGDTGTLTATSQYATNPTYSWASGNTSVLTIDASTGEYEAVAPGKATVTVTMTCTEGSASRSVTINVTPDHTLTVTEALAIAASLDGDSSETTEYFVNVKGYITSLDADEKTRAFNLSDSKTATEANTIMVYGIYAADALRTYAVLNGFAEFRGHIQNYKGTSEVKDLTLISYTDEAIEFATSAYQSLQEACNVGVDAVTSTQWETLAGEFDGIDANAKVKLTADDISNYGEAIQNWVDRYTRIVSNTELNDFMQLGVSSSLLRVSQNSLEDNNTMIIVISIAATSALAFTTLLVFKKKKQK